MQNLVKNHYEDGSLESEIWYDEEGNRHREDGPAMILYTPEGSLISEEFYVHGKAHREDGPAVIHYGADGRVTKEDYMIDGQLHREVGPAVIWYANGEPVSEEIWKFGVHMKAPHIPRRRRLF